MSTLICGSFAYDTIMVFHDRFKNHILPDKVHILNVSFLVPEMRREFGGCGNIAYNLKLLGGDPLPMGTVGYDFGPYAAWMDQCGISRRYIKVIDNASDDDVTAQTLTQIILDEGRNGRSKVPTEVLRDLVRFGERAISTGVEQVQEGMDRVVRASIDRLGPVREAREEMDRLRTRLEELEESLSDLESSEAAAMPAKPASAKKKTAAKSKSS